MLRAATPVGRWIRAPLVVLRRLPYLIAWITLTVLGLAFLTTLSVTRVVGNDLLFQFTEVFRLRDWLILGGFVALAAYALVQGAFILRHRACRLAHASGSFAASGTATLSSLLALVSCPACLVGLASFLSLGTLSTLVAWRTPILIGGALTTFALVMLGARFVVAPHCVVVRGEGLEPPTSPTSRERSTS